MAVNCGASDDLHSAQRAQWVVPGRHLQPVRKVGVNGNNGYIIAQELECRSFTKH